jgi:peptide deformylase
MAYRNIRKDNDPVLRLKAKQVNKYGNWLTKLLDDMVETMDLANGIGLAAPQIGISKRIIVIRLEEDLYRLINPEVVSEEGKVTEIEGCLSVPGMLGTVERAEKIKVIANDEEGKEIEISAEGILSIVLQHEIDHLEGILFTDIAKKVFDESELEDDEVSNKVINPELMMEEDN